MFNLFEQKVVIRPKNPSVMMEIDKGLGGKHFDRLLRCFYEVIGYQQKDKYVDETGKVIGNIMFGDQKIHISKWKSATGFTKVPKLVVRTDDVIKSCDVVCHKCLVKANERVIYYVENNFDVQIFKHLMDGKDWHIAGEDQASFVTLCNKCKEL